MNTGNKVKRDVIIILLVVVILGFGYILYSSRNTTLVPAGGTMMNTAVSTQSLDAGATVALSQIPDGFPSTIPIETGAAIQAYKSFYKEQNATQYVVSCTTTKSQTTEWNLYNSYLVQAGYTLSKTGTSKTAGVVSGTDGKDNLSVLISTAGKETNVQIHYWTSQ